MNMEKTFSVKQSVLLFLNAGVLAVCIRIGIVVQHIDNALVNAVSVSDMVAYSRKTTADHWQPADIEEIHSRHREAAKDSFLTAVQFGGR
jgi:hypothetical protein